MKSTTVPTRLFYINQNPATWRRAYMLFYTLSKDKSLKGDSLDVRDRLPEVGLPREAWIDFRVLDRWFTLEIPVPLISIFEYIVDIQDPDGAVSVNGIPNSGATYRFIELAGLLGLSAHSNVIKAKEFLRTRLKEGGLAAPGPVEGAILEVGTTARFLNVLIHYFPEETSVIKDMVEFLMGYLYRTDDRSMAFWHTDRRPEELKTPYDGIVGATSLALFALVNAAAITNKDAEAICKWLIWCQNKDGGWSDKMTNSSNLDNTFNAVRALITVKNSSLVGDELKEQLTKSIQKALQYVLAEDKSTSITAKAMKLRTLIYGGMEPLSKESLIAVEDLIRKKHLWYHPDKHLYNETLLTAIAISEWCNAIKQRHGSLKIIDRPVIAEFLTSFPLEIPPFYRGYRDNISERIANWLTRQRCKLTVVNAVSESVTLHDVVALFLSLLFMIGLFVNTDLIKAILIEGDRFVNLGINSAIIATYVGWLCIKFRLRENLIHFFLTTLMSLVLSYIIVFLWLRKGHEALLKANLFSLFRLMFLYATVLDIGRRIIDVSRLNRLFLPRSK